MFALCYTCFVHSFAASETATNTASRTQTGTATATPTSTYSVTSTQTVTQSASSSASVSPTETATRSVTPSPTFTATATPSATPSPYPFCRRCYTGTTGVCQQLSTDLCAPFASGSLCGAGFTPCVCPACTSGSGVCNFGNGTCASAADAHGRCPAGAFVCNSDAVEMPAPRSCPACASASHGPCQHPSGMCFPFLTNTTTCPSGSMECSDFSLPAVASSVCSVCTGTPGPCRSASGDCWDLFPGTAVCPAGTSSCFGNTTNVQSEVTALAGNTTVSLGAASGTSFTVTVTNVGSGSVTAAIESNPCGTAVGIAGACLPLTVRVGDTATVDALVVRLPASLNAAVPAGGYVSFEIVPDHGSTRRRLTTSGCSSSTYDATTGVVTGSSCSAGKYGLVQKMNNLAPTPSSRPVAVNSSSLSGVFQRFLHS